MKVFITSQPIDYLYYLRKGNAYKHVQAIVIIENTKEMISEWTCEATVVVVAYSLLPQ